jgi:hypothetical protein
MRHFLPLLALSGSCCVLVWSYATQPFVQDNFQAMQQCKELHPARFCEMRYAPNAFAHKQR